MSGCLDLTYSMADQNFTSTVSVGIYLVSSELLSGLAKRPDINHMTVLTNKSIEMPEFPGPTVSFQYHNYAIRSYFGRILWDQWGLYRSARQTGNEWLFLPKGYGSFLFSSPVKLAVYIHDIMPLIYATRYPGRSSRIKQLYYSLVYSATLKQAHVVFTNTIFTASEIRNWASARGMKCPPIVVAGYGVTDRQYSLNKDDTITLFVRNDPRKRTDIAIEYLAKWQTETQYTGRILCIGTLPPGITIPSDWQLRGRIQQAEFDSLLEKSRIAVCFSEYEGFGLPPVDALLAGVCPVFSDIPPTREAMLDTGCPFNNDSYTSFSEAMSKAFATSSAEIADWRRLLLSRHNWHNVCSRIIEGMLNTK